VTDVAAGGSPAPGPEAPAVVATTLDGHDAVLLRAAGYTATFVPELGMIGASLTFHGREYLSLHGGLERYQQHHTTGLPLLHPWANRLARFSYEAAGVWVDFDDTAPVCVVDGLPIHGTMNCAAGWSVEAQFADSMRSMLQARYVFSDHPDQLRSFPFPHDLVLFVELSDLGLQVTTTVHATGDRDVPISFGWHPYFVLPDVERRDLTVVLPDREHLELDVTMVPTGQSTQRAAASVVLGDGSQEFTFDDSFKLIDEQAQHRFALEGPRRSSDREGPRQRLTAEFDQFYPYAQVYAPSGAAFVAFEPMTAPTNALATRDHRSVPPGESSSASFRIWVDDPVAADPAAAED